ncbi:MAG: hypothetical protein BRC31_03965 [Actinobacteria bacterium QS_5_72_10]|nr:MAG: hypothetical protein BRC31_03965 [Actinobacteria bacterium QS_5_72_10]
MGLNAVAAGVGAQRPTGPADLDIGDVQRVQQGGLADRDEVGAGVAGGLDGFGLRRRRQGPEQPRGDHEREQGRDERAAW